jgi:hypothetical protein
MGELRMKKRKSSTPKPPHCKRVTTSAGVKRSMCFDAKGKITSKAKVEAYKKRKG